MTVKKRSVTHPEEATQEIEARLKELGMTFQQWAESLMAFDLAIGGTHKYTGDSMRTGGAERWAIWREVLAGRKAGLHGKQLFDVIFDELQARRSKE